MSGDEKLLHIVLNFNKFDEIASEKSDCIYLECCERWDKFFNNKKYRKVRLCRGLYKNPKTMILKIKNINLYYGNNDLNQFKVWIVRLGERVE